MSAKAESKSDVKSTETKSKKTKKTTTDAPAEKKERKRREVTKESVEVSFKELEGRINEEIETLRSSEEKVKGVKFLRTVNKLVKILHKDYQRVLKLKKKRNVTGNKSGFMKPVKITKDLADFTGWDANGEYSRTEVTRFICDYIRENNLQNPNDRREINPDKKLKELLKFNPETAGHTLTYFRIQQYIQPCFVKNPGADKKKKVKAEKEAPQPKEATKEAVPVKETAKAPVKEVTKAAPAKKTQKVKA